MRKKFEIRLPKQIRDGSGKEDGFEDTKTIMMGHHGKDLIQSLDEPRRHQMQFLDKSQQLLSENPEEAKIFTGLSLIVIAETAKTFDGETLSQALETDSKTRNGYKIYKPSVLVQRLVINLGVVQLDEEKKPLPEENKLEPEDIISLIDAAVNFIGDEVYINKDSSIGYKTQHSFSHIEKLKISNYLRIAAEIRSQASNELISRNDKKLKSDLKEEKVGAAKEEKAARQKEKEKAALQKEKEKEKEEKGKNSSYGIFKFLGNGPKKANLKNKKVESGEEELVTSDSEEDTDDEDNGHGKKL